MGKITRKTMFKAAGYAVGGLFLLGGLGGNLSALALGLGITSGMLFGSNAFGLRRHVPLLRSPNAWARRGGYAILWTLTLLVGAVLPTQTPAQIRAAHQAQAEATAQARAQATAAARAAATQAAQAHAAATAQARAAVAAATQAARVAPTQTAQARAQEARAHAAQTAQAQATQAAAAAAHAAQRRQQQADFRTFYGKVLGVTNECSDAHKTATQDLTAITNGSGDYVTAYQDAQSAADTCGQVSISLPSVPDDLQGYKLDEATTDLSYWAVGEQQAWQDMQKVLNNQGVVASAADFKTKLQAAQDEQYAGIALIVGAAQDLGVDIQGIQPIAPGS